MQVESVKPWFLHSELICIAKMNVLWMMSKYAKSCCCLLLCGKWRISFRYSSLFVASKFPLCVIFNVNMCNEASVSYCVYYVITIRSNNANYRFQWEDKPFIHRCSCHHCRHYYCCCCCFVCMFFNKLEILRIAHLYFEWKCERKRQRQRQRQRLRHSQSQIQIQSMWHISDVVVFFRIFRWKTFSKPIQMNWNKCETESTTDLATKNVCSFVCLLFSCKQISLPPEIARFAKWNI